MLPSFVTAEFVDLPGRNRRTADPAGISPRQIAHLIAARAARGPYAIYGHSMGARLAFEVTRELQRIAAPPPIRLYVGAAHPPHLPEPLARLVNLTEDEFIDQLILRAGAPDALRDDHDVRAALMPALRADLDWLQRYTYRPGPMSSTPLVAFAGSDDREVRPDEMLGWARHTSASFRLHTVVGDHMFLRTAGDVVTRLIAGDLAAALAASDPVVDGHASPALPDRDEIHVWRAPLDRMPEACAATAELSPREAARAAAFHRETDARRYVGRCVVLRRLLRRYGADPGTADLPTARHGKPHLNSPGDLRFSLSHSAGTVLVAFSRGDEIGVDVERLRPMADFDAFCRGALTPDERAEIAAEPEETQLRSGLRFWTAKEAVLKATGDGLRVEPSRFSFAGQAPGEPWRADPAPDLRRLTDWRVSHLELDGAVGAVATQRDGWRLRFETLVEDPGTGTR